MKKFLGIIFVFLLSGCASFPAGDNKEVAYDRTYAGKASIDFRSTSNYVDALFLQSANRSGYFGEVHKWLDVSDYDLLIERQENVLTPQSTILVTSFITGFSFYTIPSWYKVEVTYDVRLINNKDKTIKTFFYKERYYNVMNVTMLLVAPFVDSQPQDIDGRIMANLVSDLADYIYNK